MMKKKVGFTLLEIIVVIIIVGILAGLLTPLASIAIRRAKIKLTRQKLEALNKAFLLYYQSTTDVQNKLIAEFPNTGSDISEDDLTNWTSYLDDYITKENYAYDAWRVPFKYTYNVGAVSAVLRSYGPNRTGSDDDDIVYIVQAKSVWSKWRRIAQERLRKVNSAVERYKRGGGEITTGDTSEKLSGYLSGNDMYDPWGRQFRYNETLSTFYSDGADGTPGTNDDVYPSGVDTTP